MALSHQGVDRTNALGQGRHPMEQGHHRLLVGNGHVEARGPEGVQPLQGNGQVGGSHRQRHVAPIQPQLADGGVLQDGREGVAHRITQHRQKLCGPPNNGHRALKTLGRV